MPNFNVMRGFNSNGNLENNLERELELMLEEHRRSLNMIIDRERDLNIYRSGSAPPTVEGALSAVGSLLRNPNFAEFDSSSIISGSGMLTEEEIRSHPAYSSYYYSHDNLNPRLPPPLLSKEDWRVAQRLQAAGSSFEGIGDLRKKNLGDIGGGSSLFSTQPQLSAQKAGNELMELRKVSERNLLMKNTSEWMKSDHTGLVGSFGSGMGVRRKSFADILQEGRDQPSMLASSLSRSASRNAFSDTANMSGISNSHSSDTHNKAESTENLNSGTPDHGLSRAQNMGSAFNNSFYSPVGSSVTRSRINEGHLSRRVPSPSLPPISSMYSVGKNISSQSALEGISPSMTEIGDVVAPLSRLTLSKDQLHDEDSLSQSQFQTGFGKLSKHLLDISDSRVHNLQRYANHTDLGREEDFVADIDISNVGLDGKVSFPIRASSSSNVHLKFNSSGFGPNIMYQNNDFLGVDFPMCGSSGYSSNQKLNIASLSSGSSGNGQSLGRNASQAGSSLHSSAMGCAYVRSVQNFPDYVTHATPSPCKPSCGRNYFEISPGHGDFQTLDKAYHEALFSQQNKRYQPQFLDKVGGLNHQYNMNSAFGLGVQQQRKPVVFSGVGCRSPFFQNGLASPYTSIGGSTGINMERRFVSPLLEELKGSKAASLELSDIVGHVVEFSKDQYGSRFIQQKLETATAEAKAKIFQEIVAHARGLMTDVFGNYVIQKFFEHGTENQIQELANQLIGYVLPLSHQMYGCRVIQKALEVVGVNQQTQMVTELDGSILKCVRDQNGNHVIQKCIECVPQDRIQFILSAFFGQVVPLSMHPYGCRVIQRVLEHCDDPNTQQTIMGEIMQSVCTLAQDQYGNYVIQHILQHGRAHERSGIIIKLAGQIVKLSQHKFASNVVEKCLTFGGPEECQLLINEILGSTDENEPLQAMMKDPFGNFVVQKVLETCDDQSRELVISRIKVHLNTLKRYTYGKHIVSRVEKLISAGEKCIGSAPSNSSLHSPIF